MKKCVFLILLLLSTFIVIAQTALETQLCNFPINNYLRKPIDTLLAHLPIGFDTAFEVGSSGNVNHGACLLIYYPNNEFWVSIDIYDAQYITVQRSTRLTRTEDIWPIALLRKEKIRGVEILSKDYQVINEAWIY